MITEVGGRVVQGRMGQGDGGLAILGAIRINHRLVEIGGQRGGIDHHGVGAARRGCGIEIVELIGAGGIGDRERLTRIAHAVVVQIRERGHIGNPLAAVREAVVVLILENGGADASRKGGERCGAVDGCERISVRIHRIRNVRSVVRRGRRARDEHGDINGPGRVGRQRTQVVPQQRAATARVRRDRGRHELECMAAEII